MKTTLVVLAAGMGSRYGGLKQLDPVGPNGEVILDYSVRDALAAGFRRVVFVIRRDFADAFRSGVASRYENQCEVAFAYQETGDLPAGVTAPEDRTKPWGTGHAVLAARSIVDSPFLVVNADDYYGPESYQLIHSFLLEAGALSRPSIAMAAYRLENTLSENGAVSRGVCRLDATSHLLSVEEHTGIQRSPGGLIKGLNAGGVECVLDGSAPVSMNFWGFTPQIFPLLESLFAGFLESGKISDPKAEFYIPSAVTEMIGREGIAAPVFVSPSSWFGVTVREDRETVVRALREIPPVRVAD